MTFMLGVLFVSLGLSGGVLPLEGAAQGFCAHLTKHEFADRERIVALAQEAGFGSVRFDFDGREVGWLEDKAGDYTNWDKVIDTVTAAGLDPLVGFDGGADAALVLANLDKWRAFVRRSVARYRGRVHHWEVWNEENSETFWRNVNATNYVTLLRATSAEIKVVDPAAQVLLGGLAHVPTNYIEQVYRAGGKDCFDIMNVHPYTRPNPPERRMIRELTDLRSVMTQYGDADKPIWITEIGWPVPKRKVFDHFAWRNGLSILNPTNRPWRAIYAAAEPDGARPDEGFRCHLASLLPAGSTVRWLTPSQVNRALANHEADLVFYPFTVNYPADTMPSVLRFIAAGGVLVKAGGAAFYQPFRFLGEGEWGVDAAYDSSADRRALRTRMTGFWNDAALPISARFYTRDYLKPGDTLRPLVTILDAKGCEAYPAAIFSYGDRKGHVIVDGYWGKGYHDEEPNTPDEQARYLPRAFAIAAAMGVARTYLYEFQSRGLDPDGHAPEWMENHFGIVRADFRPKTAYHTVKTYHAMRPSGSRTYAAAWQDDARKFYYPQWTLPDGTSAGMFWTAGNDGCRQTLTFDGEVTEFRDLMGRTLDFKRVGTNAYRVVTGGAAVYFKGARCTGLSVSR